MFQAQAELIKVLMLLLDETRFSKEVRDLAEEKLKVALNSIQF